MPLPADAGFTFFWLGICRGVSPSCCLAYSSSSRSPSSVVRRQELVRRVRPAGGASVGTCSTVEVARSGMEVKPTGFSGGTGLPWMSIACSRMIGIFLKRGGKR